MLRNLCAPCNGITVRHQPDFAEIAEAINTQLCNDIIANVLLVEVKIFRNIKEPVFHAGLNEHVCLS